MEKTFCSCCGKVIWDWTTDCPGCGANQEDWEAGKFTGTVESMTEKVAQCRSCGTNVWIGAGCCVECGSINLGAVKKEVVNGKL